MTINSSNIISLESWKEATLETREEASFLNYLRALSFHDLMTEAESARSELNTGSINRELTLKYKIILQEFSNRLKADGLSASLNSITKSAENKLTKLKTLL